MRRFLVWLCMLLPNITFAGISIDSLKNMDILFVEIITENGEEPYSENIHRPDGCLGDGITNMTKVPGNITIWKRGGIIYSSGDYVEDKSGMTIRHRGNTSAAYFDKKPFKIKLQKKADLLFRDDSNCKDKDWLLLRGTTMYEDLSWTVDKLLNDKWVPSFEYCNVSLNGDYRGLYLLCESIKKSKGRIDVDDNGYIFEYDAYWWNEPLYINSRWEYEFQYTLKYPDTDDITQEQIDYLTDYITRMEDAMDNGTYEDYIDISSWVRWMLAHDVLGSYDQAGSNKFIVKPGDSDKCYMGPIWDFDGIEMTPNNWARIHYFAPFGSILFPSLNKSYSKAYVELWNEKKQLIQENIQDWIQGISNKKVLIQELNTSRAMDFERWGEQVKTVEDELEQHRLWFEERIPWLESNINQIDIGVNGIINTPSNSENYRPQYNIFGLKVNNKYKGIVVTIDGKKYINQK